MLRLRRIPIARSLRALALVLVAGCGSSHPFDLGNRPPVPDPDPSGDREQPVLRALDFQPNRVNIIVSPENIEFLVTATDEGTGIRQVTAHLSPPSGPQITGFFQLHRITGDPHDGTYQGFVSIPPGSESGRWTVSFVQLEDEAGNRRTWETAELEALGFPFVLQVDAAVIG